MEVNPYAEEVMSDLAGHDSSQRWSVIQLGPNSPASLIKSVQEWALLDIKASELQFALDQSSPTEPVEESGRLWSHDELLERLGIANDLKGNARIRLVAECHVNVFQVSSTGITQEVASRRLIDVRLDPIELQITPEHGYIFTGAMPCRRDESSCGSPHTHNIYTVILDWWGIPTSLAVTTEYCAMM